MPDQVILETTDLREVARRRGQRLARVLLGIALVALGAYTIENFLRALVWAAILVVATWPLYQRAQRRIPPGKRNVLLPTVFTLGTFLVFVLPIALLLIQVSHEAGVVATMVNDTREHGAPLPDALAHLPMGQAQVTDWWNANLADPEGARVLLGRVDRAELLTYGRTFGSRLLHGLILFVFTLLTLFFLYKEGSVLTRQVVVAGTRLFGPSGERVGKQIIASIHGTVDGLVLVGLGVGAILGIAYAVLGVAHPALLGAATAVGAMVPLCATIVLVVASLSLLAAGQTVSAIGLFVFGTVVIFAADHFVRPSLIGGATRLPFLWVLLGILGGVETFGLLGLFLGPAVMAALILLWREWTGDAMTEADT